jgi:hypothetical protein
MTRRRCSGCLALAVVAGLGAPAGAHAVIVPQRSMLGISLGMTRAQAIAVGAPTSIAARRDIFGPYTQLYYARPAVRVILRRGASGRQEVISLATRRGVERTAEGVGVGTAEGTLRARLRGERCRTFRGVRPALRQCWIGAYEPGRVTTVFDVTPRTRVVRRVSVGVVVD